MIRENVLEAAMVLFLVAATVGLGFSINQEHHRLQLIEKYIESCEKHG